MTQKSVFLISFPFDLDLDGPRTSPVEPQSTWMGKEGWHVRQEGPSVKLQYGRVHEHRVTEKQISDVGGHLIVKAFPATCRSLNLILNVMENQFQC